MKVTVEVECTPDEARQFLGLPDVKPMQAAVMGRIEQQMVAAADAMAPDAILRTWLSLLPQSTAQFQETMARLFGGAGLAGRSSG
jgi:hypothetical protein